MKKFYFFYTTSSSQVLGRVDPDGKISFRGKIILLGNQEKIKKEGYYMADLIEKEKCFIAVRVVEQTPFAREENTTDEKYYPQIRCFDEKYLKTKNINDETEIVYARGVNPSLIFKMSEEMLPYKEEILAYYEEFISSPERYLGNKIIREVIEPELLFGNTSEYSWGFYRIHKEVVSICSTDIGVANIKKVYVFKESERRVLVPHNILRKKLLRHEEGRMAAMGIVAAFGGPRSCKTSNPVEEYILECENKIVRAVVKTSIYYDSNEEHVFEQQELSRKIGRASCRERV